MISLTTAGDMTPVLSFRAVNAPPMRVSCRFHGRAPD